MSAGGGQYWCAGRCTAKIVSTEEELEERVAQLLEKVGTRGSGGGNSSMMDAALTAAFGLGLGMFLQS